MQLALQESQTSTSKKWDWMIPVAALTVSTAAFIASLSYAVFSIKTWTAKRDSDLVNIGISVLQVDPEKEKQISAAREWALNLIDANAGGVKFSPEARAQLLREPLKYGYSYDYSYPIEPAPRRPSAEPPK
ncbi:MAG: hypothetical protein ACREDD_04350 [Methylocella sp.]